MTHQDFVDKFHAESDGALIVIEYCHVYNGKPGDCSECALALALDF